MANVIELGKGTLAQDVMLDSGDGLLVKTTNGYIGHIVEGSNVPLKKRHAFTANIAASNGRTFSRPTDTDGQDIFYHHEGNTMWQVFLAYKYDHWDVQTWCAYPDGEGSHSLANNETGVHNTTTLNNWGWTLTGADSPRGGETDKGMFLLYPNMRISFAHFVPDMTPHIDELEMGFIIRDLQIRSLDPAVPADAHMLLEMLRKQRHHYRWSWKKKGLNWQDFNRLDTAANAKNVKPVHFDVASGNGTFDGGDLVSVAKQFRG